MTITNNPYYVVYHIYIYTNSCSDFLKPMGYCGMTITDNPYYDL